MLQAPWILIDDTVDARDLAFVSTLSGQSKATSKTSINIHRCAHIENI